jgi:hypothetical protein
MFMIRLLVVYMTKRPKELDVTTRVTKIVEII